MGKRRSRKWNFKSFRRWGILGRLALRMIPYGFALGTLGLIFFGVRHTLHADPYFFVERITVFPSGLLTDSEHQYLERSVRNKSLFEIDLGEISRNLEKNPQIKRAEIIRELPNQLNVRLTSRLPFIQVQLREQGLYYLVGSDRFILSAQASPAPEVMVVEDFHSAGKSGSTGTLYANRYFEELSDLLEILETDPLFKEETVSKLALDQLGNVTVVLKDGVEIKAGKRIRLSENTRAVLASLLKPETRSQILYIDLRFRDLIVKRKLGV